MRTLMPDDHNTFRKAPQIFAESELLVHNAATRRKTCTSSKKPETEHYLSSISKKADTQTTPMCLHRNTQHSPDGELIYLQWLTNLKFHFLLSSFFHDKKRYCRQPIS